MDLRQRLSISTQAFLNGEQPTTYLVFLHEGIATMKQTLNPDEYSIVEYTSGTPYYVFRTPDGLNYALIHSTTTFNKQQIYVVHTVVQNLGDIFDPATGLYKGLWGPQNLGDLDDLDDPDDPDNPNDPNKP